MRKQTKIAAVVSATALLALGASFTSMAATYDWRTDEAGEQVCYDANGELYEEAWVEYAGDKYFMDEDGHIVKDSWIEGDDDLYFVDEEGKMVKNNWVETIEYDADEDADELDWFYFGANGKLATSKKIAWNDTYYFVDEYGKMLTGWVEYSKDTADNKVVTVAKEATKETKANKLFYANEDGTLATSMWLNDFGPGVTDEEIEDLDETFLKWYYIKADGALQTGKAADIDGNTYFFGHKTKTDGAMLSGWVKKVSTSEYVPFEDVIGEDVSYKNLYFCGDENEGWLKKDQWIKVAKPEYFADANEDTTTYWYWLDKSGNVFIPQAAKATITNAVEFTNGEAVHATLNSDYVVGLLTATDTDVMAQELEVNKKTYIFNAEGQMMSGLQMINDKMYYYGESTDGAKKTGLQSVKDKFDDYYTMYFATNTKNKEAVGEAITGTEGKYLYVDGILQKSSDDELYKVVIVGGKEYIVDENGIVQSSTTKKYEFENYKNGQYKIEKFSGKDREKNYVNGEWKAQ